MGLANWFFGNGGTASPHLLRPDLWHVIAADFTPAVNRTRTAHACTDIAACLYVHRSPTHGDIAVQQHCVAAIFALAYAIRAPHGNASVHGNRNKHLGVVPGDARPIGGKCVTKKIKLRCFRRVSRGFSGRVDFFADQVTR